MLLPQMTWKKKLRFFSEQIQKLVKERVKSVDILKVIEDFNAHIGKTKYNNISDSYGIHERNLGVTDSLNFVKKMNFGLLTFFSNIIQEDFIDRTRQQKDFVMIRQRRLM